MAPSAREVSLVAALGRGALRPTARGVGALVFLAALAVVTGVVPSAGGVGLCVAVGLALGGACAAVAIAAKRLGALSLWVAAPERLARGRHAVLTIAVGGPRPALGCQLSLDRTAVRWRTAKSPGRTAKSPEPAEPLGTLAPPPDARLVVGEGEPATVRLAVPAHERGVVRSRYAALWLHDGLGLVGRLVATVPELAVVVHPPAGDPGPLPARARHSKATPLGDPIGAPLGADVVGLRPYEPGDPISSLHWRSDTRRGPLLVRERGAPRLVSGRVVLDDRAGVHRRAGFERALEQLLGVVLALRAAGPLEVRALCARTVVAVPAGGPAPALLGWLAVVEPRWGEALGGDAPGAPRPGDLVVTTATGAESLATLLAVDVDVVVAR